MSKIISKTNSIKRADEHILEMPIIEHFYTAQNAQQIIDNIDPFIIHGRKFITFDTETHKHDIENHEVKNTVRRWIGSGKTAKAQDYPFVVSICDGKKAYTLYDYPENNYNEFKKLSVIFEDPDIHKIAHNIKFDMHMLQNINMRLIGPLHDTVVLAKLINENRHSFELKNLAEPYKGILVFEDLLDQYKKIHKVIDYRDFPTSLLSNYANADVWNCYLLFKEEYPQLDTMYKLYKTEMQVTIVLYAMERYGILLNKDYENALKKELADATNLAEQEIYTEAKNIFNINSSVQLYDILMDLSVDPKRIPKTEKGNNSLDKKVLKKMTDIPLVNKILDFRNNSKLYTTYAVGMYEQIDYYSRVHGNIKQTEAVTGRMSVNKPALQTLPKKEKRIRKAFIPTPGYNLVFMDLDQIEYRLFAHYAEAEGLIEAIKKGYDVHQATASLVYKVPYASVNEQQRNRAKTINFALIYGMGNAALADALGLTLAEAIDFSNDYFMAIPEALPFIRFVKVVVAQRGYSINAYGRRRHLEADQLYKAPNSLIQGCAADYIKNKMVLIYKYLLKNQLKSRIILIVHDELVFEIHKEEMYILKTLQYLLSDYKNFCVPITAGIDIGNPSWGDKKPYKDLDLQSLLDTQDLNYPMFNGHIFDIKEINNE